MKNKHVLCPGRLRQLPAHWSWVDHRLVRDEHVGRCDAPALALYLFLVCVADAQGLSYYSDRSICQRLRWEPAVLTAARERLAVVGLVAYEKPLYQVLELDPSRSWMTPSLRTPAPSDRGDEARPIAGVVRQMLGGVA